MAENENQRVKLTKRLLRESLIKMLNTESIHKISVRELCQEAGINRTTFYKYYGSQYDLLTDMENELIDQLRLILFEEKAELGALTNLILYLEQNLELTRHLLNNSIDKDFPERLISMPIIQDFIKSYLGEQYSEGQFEYVSSFIVQGSYNILKLWINKENREKAADIAALIGGIGNRICNR